jgi:hypothetical protein
MQSQVLKLGTTRRFESTVAVADDAETTRAPPESLKMQSRNRNKNIPPAKEAEDIAIGRKCRGCSCHQCYSVLLALRSVCGRLQNQLHGWVGIS